MAGLWPVLVTPKSRFAVFDRTFGGLGSPPIELSRLTERAYLTRLRRRQGARDVEFGTCPSSRSFFHRAPGATTRDYRGTMSEILLRESDSVEWAVKAFRRKVQRSGVLKELRQKRYYTKPSLAKRLKKAAARRRGRAEARRARRTA